MTDLTQWVSSEFVAFITLQEKRWLEAIFTRFDGYPNLQQIWSLMDKCWCALDCDSAVMDNRISDYYSHPVWLLNGLFIEQHQQSLENRSRFAEWVAAQSPRRVADYGGGFGSLARMIGEVCPTAEVEVIEPHPHQMAIERAARTKNVRYRAQLDGEYDILIATDVFEHVPDPLALVAETALSLRLNGQYLIANCFAPVILCHLPQTFHFRYSWNAALSALGLCPAEKVAYGQVFTRPDILNVELARKVEDRSKRLWNSTQYTPSLLARVITQIWI